MFNSNGLGRSIGILSLVFSYASFAPLAAWSAVDLVGSIQPGSVQKVTYDSGGPFRNTDLIFNIQLQNNGTAAATGIVTLKPILIPKNLSWGTLDLRSPALPAVRQLVDLQPGASKTIQYHGTLPNMPLQEYSMFVSVNANSLIAESSQLNNTTALVDLGPLGGPAAFRPIGFDFWTEINQARVINNRGRASSGFRTVALGDLSYFPSTEIDDNNLFARFFAVNASDRSVHTMSYNGDAANVEKQWCCLPWQNEHDKNGQAIGVDYYSQAPSFQHIPPGRYHYLSVINSRDLILEDTIANNVDIHPLELRALFSSQREIWFNQSSDPAELRKILQLNSDYQVTGNWRVTAQNLTWLTMPVTNGPLNGAVNLEMIVTQAPGQNVAGELIFTHDAFPMNELRVPVRYFAQTQPSITVSSRLNFNFRQAADAQNQEIVMRNTSNQAVRYLIEGMDPNNPWINVQEGDGVIPAGGEKRIAVLVDPYAKAPGEYRGELKVKLSSDTRLHTVEIYARITQP